jgi:hypothetical protein
MVRIFTAAVALIALAVTSFVPASAQRSARIQAGVLTCDVSAGWGLIVGSQRSVSCEFAPDGGRGPRERYVGTITKVGLDIGATARGVMIWAVFADTTLVFGALAGNYAGASAEATIAAGLGANVLVGGSNRTIALQPLSVSGQVGLNLAVGVAELSLRPAR